MMALAGFLLKVGHVCCFVDLPDEDQATPHPRVLSHFPILTHCTPRVQTPAYSYAAIAVALVAFAHRKPDLDYKALTMAAPMAVFGILNGIMTGDSAAAK